MQIKRERTQSYFIRDLAELLLIAIFIITLIAGYIRYQSWRFDTGRSRYALDNNSGYTYFPLIVSMPSHGSRRNIMIYYQDLKNQFVVMDKGNSFLVTYGNHLKPGSTIPVRSVRINGIYSLDGTFQSWPLPGGKQRFKVSYSATGGLNWVCVWYIADSHTFTPVYRDSYRGVVVQITGVLLSIPLWGMGFLLLYKRRKSRRLA